MPKQDGKRRTQAQLLEALRESERRTTGLLNAITEPILLIDPAGTILAINPAMARRLGRAVDQLLGNDVYAFLPPEIAQGRRAQAERVIQTREPLRFEDQRGDTVLESHLAPLLDPSGRVVALAVFAIDITERRRAEQAHRQTEERYRSIVETAEEGIWVVDRNWRLTFVNPRLTQMFGYPAEEMLGRPITDFMDEEERSLAPTHMRLRERGQRSTHDSKFRRKDGSVLWTIVAGNPLTDEAGRYTGALALIADITERKAAEEKLRASAEALEALSRRLLEVRETERQALARELHDEVGQSLTLLKLAVDRCQQADPADASSRLEETQAMLGELVQRVRHMSLDLRPSMLDDLGLLPALLWQFDRYRAQTRIEVLFTQRGLEGRRFGAHVETAAFRLVQEALTNVARHAGVPRVAVHVGAEHEVLRIQIQDGGRGFDVEAALTAHASVGLRGMSERVRLLGGTLQINSDPGAGTFLTAALPLGSPAPSRASPG